MAYKSIILWIEHAVQYQMQQFAESKMWAIYININLH